MKWKCRKWKNREDFHLIETSHAYIVHTKRYISGSIAVHRFQQKIEINWKQKNLGFLYEIWYHGVFAKRKSFQILYLSLV